MSNTIVSALVVAMTTLAPPAKLAAAPAWPGWEESAAERLERYEGIAAAVYRVAFDPANAPLYRGPDGRKKTAGLLLGIAWIESGFARDVDLGPCYLGRDGKGSRCDRGRSACMLQIQIGQGTTREGWTQADLFGDRAKCFQAGYDLVRRSFVACMKHGYDHALDAYTDGVCNSITAAARGKVRLAIGRRMWELAFPTWPGPDARFLVPKEPTTAAPSGPTASLAPLP